MELLVQHRPKRTQAPPIDTAMRDEWIEAIEKLYEIVSQWFA